LNCYNTGMFNWSSKSISRTRLVLLIDAGVIALMVVQDRPTKAGKILYKTHTIMQDDFLLGGDFSQRQAALRGKLRLVFNRVTRYMQKNHQPITEIDCVLGAPWATSMIRHEVETFSKPRSYTHRLEESILRKLLVSIVKEPSFVEQHSRELLGYQMPSVRLNGYHLDNPYEMKAEKVGITLLLGLISVPFKKMLSDLVGEYFHHNVNFMTLVDTVYPKMVERLNLHNGLLVYVSGERTYVIVISEGQLVTMSSFPRGSIQLIRTLAAKMETSTWHVTTLLSVLDHGGVSAAYDARISEMLQSILEGWVEDLVDSIRQENIQRYVQSLEQVFLIAPQSMCGIMCDEMNGTKDFRDVVGHQGEEFVCSSVSEEIRFGGNFVMPISLLDPTDANETKKKLIQ
jgi:hypothetical protein